MLPPIASRFVAGESDAAALERARRLNDRGVGAILNLLGEHYDRPERAGADADTYERLVGDIGRTDLDACVSVKPSQLGLDAGADTFRRTLSRVVDRADEAGVFVWIDMEDHTTTDATLDAFEAETRRHGGTVGVCLQANLRRTRADLERLAGLPGKVRLVKGAYDEPAEIAYTDHQRVNEAYRDHLGYLFRAFDGGVAVGSHDPAMIEHARGLHDEYGTDFEIQMLMGVREDAQFELAREFDVYQYAPYGSRWLSYFYRRVAERKENLAFAVRAIVN
ncbi:proline dehydrogenase family protein [Halorientalis litorea]|jgi:proline dehydrogenase|uniref:proline dehydrogenase family protein n=1 Tax=Halorientalis litorea TaxID=2931977 RepID=UPI001FF64CD0|nr:proline dehydrogenase family protein [Halorientalis litorea]